MSTDMGKPVKNRSFGFVRNLIAVLYRQAGLIALCALAGAGVSLVPYVRHHASSTKMQAARQDAQPFIEDDPQRGTGQDRRTGEATSAAIEASLAQARDDLRQCEDRIVALLVEDGGRADRDKIGDADATAEGGLKLDLDLDPEAAAARGSAGPMAVALKTQVLQLRLDEAHPLATDAAGNVLDASPRRAGEQQRLAGVVRENTPLEVELDRLERVRELAQERFVELQRELDQIGVAAHRDPMDAGGRAVGDAPEESKGNAVALLGTAAGLLLGLLVAALRELGGGRMRSPREAEWALGVPVLDAIPTLSAKARNACLGLPLNAPDASPAEPA